MTQTIIPTGRDNAIPRASLAALLGVSDRKAREYVQHRREAGELILNAQDGRGYYVAGPDDLDELEAQYRQDTHRAMTILARRKHIRRILKAAGREV